MATPVYVCVWGICAELESGRCRGVIHVQSVSSHWLHASTIAAAAATNLGVRACLADTHSDPYCPLTSHKHQLLSIKCVRDSRHFLGTWMPAHARTHAAPAEHERGLTDCLTGLSDTKRTRLGAINICNAELTNKNTHRPPPTTPGPIRPKTIVCIIINIIIMMINTRRRWRASESDGRSDGRHEPIV